MDGKQELTRFIWDVEANGLRDTADRIWCICGKNLDGTGVVAYLGEELTPQLIIDTFKDKIIIGHNIINFDIPIVKDFYGVDLLELLPKENIIDTLIWSQTLWPDRPLPRKCPTHIQNPVTGKSKIIGPHSLEAWGFRVGNKKVEIHDWTKFEPEIIDRCLMDIEINRKTYIMLCEEAGISP